MHEIRRVYLVLMQPPKMLQHLWFNIIVICCIITSTLDFRLDLKRRLVKPLWPWLRVIIYTPIYVNLLFAPLSLWEGLRMSLSHLTNPVAKSANIATILVRIVMFLLFGLSIYKRNRKLEKWLERAADMQTNYFDKLPGDEAREKSISHRKWLYFNSAVACLHYITDSCGVLNANFSRLGLFYMVTIQHFYMLVHGALVCYLRECFGLLYQELRKKDAVFPLSRIYNQLHCLHRELNAMCPPIDFVVQLHGGLYWSGEINAA